MYMFGVVGETRAGLTSREARGICRICHVVNPALGETHAHDYFEVI